MREGGMNGKGRELSEYIFVKSASQLFESVCVKHLKVWIYVDVVNTVMCQSKFTKLCLKLYLCVYLCLCCLCG